MRTIRRAVSLLALLALSVGTLTLLSAGSADAVGNVLHVPGQYPTIQAAVDAAGPSGATIIVQPGTYHESVVITKDKITIRGAHQKPDAVLMPPADPNTGCNAAPGGELDGFCIAPSGPQPVKDIEIAGLTVKGFPASGIFAFNADGLNFHDNILVDNGQYGIARFNSSHTRIVNNTVSGSGEAGIYVGDSPNATAFIWHNTVTNNGKGIFLRDASHGLVFGNTATGNCFGILLIDTGAPGAASDWWIAHNKTDDNTRACPGVDGPPTSGGGIVVVGGAKTWVTGNHASGNQPSRATAVSGGIAVISAACLGGADPTFVRVIFNDLDNNLPGDVVYDGTGSHNTFFANGASPTTVPPLACGP